MFDSTEYIKFIINSQARNLPLFYFLINTHGFSIENMNGLRSTKDHVKRRIEQSIYREELKDTGSWAFQKKKEFRDSFLKLKEIGADLSDDDIKYASIAIRTIDESFIKDNQNYFMSWLRNVFDNRYQSIGKNITADVKKAICYVDEVLFKQEYLNKK